MKDVRFIGSLEVELPSQVVEDWKGIKSDNYRPDRQRALIEALDKDFPNLRVTDDYEMIMQMIGRSRVLREWYSNWQIYYLDELVVPRYFEDFVRPEDYKKSLDKLRRVNELMAARSNDLQLAAIEYKEKLNIINQKYSNIDSLCKSDKILFITTLQADMLPVGLIQQIEKFTPTGNGPTEKQYTRELLINFKISLLSLLKEDPNLDIVKYVDSIQLKY